MTNKYNPSITTKYLGSMGTKHKSAAEAKASFILHKHGWIPCEKPFPMTFLDSEGQEFHACPDFYHPATCYYAEFKTRELNTIRNKRTAENAKRRADEPNKSRYRKKSNPTFDQLKFGWNHSINKIAAVAKGLYPNIPFVVIYETEMDMNEEKRCFDKGIFMLTLQNMSVFQFALKLASKGLAVGFDRNGFGFNLNPSD